MYKIPPWEVRANITKNDIVRMNLWHESKAQARDFKEAEQRRMAMQARLLAQARAQQRGRPR